MSTFLTAVLAGALGALILDGIIFLFFLGMYLKDMDNEDLEK